MTYECLKNILQVLSFLAALVNVFSHFSFVELEEEIVKKLKFACEA